MARYMGGPRGRRARDALPAPLIASPVSSDREIDEIGDSDEDPTSAILQQNKDEIPDSDDTGSSSQVCFLPIANNFLLTDNMFEG